MCFLCCSRYDFKEDLTCYLYLTLFYFSICLFAQHCLLKSCQEIKQKYPEAKSGIHPIDPLQTAKPIEVFCEFDIEGGGFSFLPHGLTFRSDGKEIVDALFKDKKNVLLKLKEKVAGKESYTLIQPHPHYPDIGFGVLVNSYCGYTKPLNDFMKEYIFLGILPESVARNETTQGFKSNGVIIQFDNCDKTPNSLFAFMPNRERKTLSKYLQFDSNSRFEERGVAVDWRSTAKNIPNPEHTMPQKFFFLTELHFGGCGCYTSSDRWSTYGFNATAIGIR